MYVSICIYLTLYVHIILQNSLMKCQYLFNSEDNQRQLPGAVQLKKIHKIDSETPAMELFQRVQLGAITLF